jgi:hypothetical protein
MFFYGNSMVSMGRSNYPYSPLTTIINYREPFMFTKTVTLKLIILSYSCCFQVFAGADSQYPAYDFEPKIQFQSPEAASHTNGTSSKSSSQKKNDSQYPAANFQPKIQFQDSDLMKSSAQQAAKPTPVKKVAAAPKPTPKPARSVSKPSSSKPATAVVTESVAQASDADSESDDTESSFGITIFSLLILAVLGYSFKNKIIENALPEGLGNVVRAINETTLTGVEKYLAKKKPQPDTKKNDAFKARPTS